MRIEKYFTTLYNKLQKYTINGKLNRKQSEKVKPLLKSLFKFFMIGQLSNEVIEKLNLIRRGKTTVADEFAILSFYNEMNFKEIYKQFGITESDLHHLKKYYDMHYYKFPSRVLEELKGEQTYSFYGIARKRSIGLYNISLEKLNSVSDLSFKVLAVDKFEISILLGKKGKRTRFYPDRSLKFFIPKNLFSHKRIKVKIYSRDPEIITILDEIKGHKRLVPSNSWFKASISPLQHCCLVTVNSKGLTKALQNRKIRIIYCDVRSNYLIICPSSIRPSRKSYVAQIYPSGKICFSIPENKPIRFVGVSGIKIDSIDNFFQTDEEAKIAEALLSKGHNILAISQQQEQDLKILKVGKDSITEVAAMQIKNIKLNPPSAGHVFGDLYKCLRFSSRTSKRSFFLINRHWKKHHYFTNFEGESTIDFSEKHSTHIIFTDYSKGWQDNVLNEIETYLL